MGSGNGNENHVVEALRIESWRWLKVASAACVTEGMRPYANTWPVEQSGDEQPGDQELIS